MRNCCIEGLKKGLASQQIELTQAAELTAEEIAARLAALAAHNTTHRRTTMDNKTTKRTLPTLQEFFGVEEGQEFVAWGLTYKIKNGELFVTDKAYTVFFWELSEATMETWAGQTIAIQPTREYSQETIELAKKDIHRFGWVCCNAAGACYITPEKPTEAPKGWRGVSFLEMCEDEYSEIGPMECVALQDIIDSEGR